MKQRCLMPMLIVALVALVGCGAVPPGVVAPPSAVPPPTPAGTAAPVDVAGMRETLRLGSGALRGVMWSPDGEQLWLVSAIGLYRYAVGDWGAPEFVPAPVGGAHALSPDGKLLATEIKNRGARLWDVAAGRATHDLPGVWFPSIAFSGDGRRVVTGGWSVDTKPTYGLVIAWDAATGAEVGRLRLDDGLRVEELAVSADGRRVAVVDAQMGVRVWEVDTGEMLGRFTVMGLQDVSFSADGGRVRMGSREWDALAGEALPSALAVDGGAVVLSPDGRFALNYDAPLLAQGDATVRLLEVATGRERWRATARRPGITVTTDEIIFSADGRRVAIAGGRKIVQAWDVATGQALGELTWPNQGFETLAVSPDRGRLATVTGDYQVDVWQLDPPARLGGPPARADTAAWAPDGRLALCERDSMTVWQLEKERPDVTMPGSEYPCDAAAFSPDGKLLVAVTNGDDVMAWDMTRARRLPPLKGHISSVTDLAWAPDGTFFVTASNDATLKVWDAARSEPVRTFSIGHYYDVMGLSGALSPDGMAVAGGSTDGGVTVYRTADGEKLARLEADDLREVSIRGLAFSPDGAVLAAGDDLGRIHLWDWRQGARLRVLAGHTQGVTRLAWVGGRLVSASRDGTVGVWE